MNFILFLLYIAAAYFTYVKSARHNSNPYLWMAIALILPFISLPIALLYFRGKPVSNPNASRLPLGYRTKTPWKMVLATLIYGLWLLVVGVGVLTDTADTGITPGIDNKIVAD